MKTLLFVAAFLLVLPGCSPGKRQTFHSNKHAFSKSYKYVRSNSKTWPDNALLNKICVDKIRTHFGPYSKFVSLKKNKIEQQQLSRGEITVVNVEYEIHYPNWSVAVKGQFFNNGMLAYSWDRSIILTSSKSVKQLALDFDELLWDGLLTKLEKTNSYYMTIDRLK